jgi:hypothetical protein
MFPCFCLYIATSRSSKMYSWKIFLLIFCLSVFVSLPYLRILLGPQPLTPKFFVIIFVKTRERTSFTFASSAALALRLPHDPLRPTKIMQGGFVCGWPTQIKNLNPLSAASSKTMAPPKLTAPSTCSPRSSFPFSLTRRNRRMVAARMAMNAVAEHTDIATTDHESK